MIPHVSICIATHNKPAHLRRVLDSIEDQQPVFDFEFETIVVDDGSEDRDTAYLCQSRPWVTYHRIDREPGYRNPSVARNVAYRAARGEIIIAQSDDVEHAQPDCIERLAAELRQGTFVIARVLNVHPDTGEIVMDPAPVFTGPSRCAFFFLGSLYRRDLYAVGGNDETYTAPGYEDDWFNECLMRGLGLTPKFSDVVGHHLHHHHQGNDPGVVEPSRLLYQEMMRRALLDEIPWRATGGPWI
jgi:glycosyltransferase involved in cell wall biosynthesis